jgi:hypothetical protein
LLGPVQRADVKGNAAVRGAVGEELADQVLRRSPGVVFARIRIPGVGQQADFLHHAARHQTAHGMRDDDHFVRAGLAQHKVDQVIEAGGGGFYIETGRADPVMKPGVQPLENTLMRLGNKRSRGLVVEPVHPQRGRRKRAVRRILQKGMLVSMNQQLILLVDHKPQHRAFELVKHGVAVAANPHMSGTVVKPVERVVDLGVDARRRPGVSPHINDREPIHPRTPQMPAVAAC